MEMNAMQAVASSALPTSLPPALPLRSSSSKQFSGIRSLKREFPRLKCESRSGRVEVRAHDCEDDDEIASSSSVLYSVAPLILLADSTGYSQASYNTTLGLFLLSLPGVWSLVKRATKSKIVKKTFNMPGPTIAGGKSPKQIAAEITSFFTRNNFQVKDRSDVVTFEGVMTASRGQAAFLTFCTFVSLGSAGLVLSIANQDIGQNAYYITLLSPLAGAYYWRKATRTEQIQVKIVVADDESSSEIVVQGDDEQIDRMRRELGLMEKGMVYVKGILEQ